jgi:hypothetical protein
VLAGFWIDPFEEIVDDCGEGLFSLLVEIGYGYPGSQDGIIGVCGSEVSSGFGGKVLQVSKFDISAAHIQLDCRTDTSKQRPVGDFITLTLRCAHP